MTYSNYTLGGAVALVKLGVSPRWVSQKILNSYRKGLTKNRIDNFEYKMEYGNSRTRQPRRVQAFDPTAVAPKTEVHPIRPDVDWEYYQAHRHNLNKKQMTASRNLRALTRIYPDHTSAPEDIQTVFNEYGRYVRNPPYTYAVRRPEFDISELRAKSPNLSDEQISNFSSPDGASYALPTGHPRTDYIRGLIDIDSAQDVPHTQAGRQVQENLRPEQVASRKADYAGLNSAPPDKPATPPNFLRNSLIGAGAIGIPTAGYAAYQHFNKKEPRE